jgi:hypothetical protein
MSGIPNQESALAWDLPSLPTQYTHNCYPVVLSLYDFTIQVQAQKL